MIFYDFISLSWMHSDSKYLKSRILMKGNFALLIILCNACNYFLSKYMVFTTERFLEVAIYR